MRILRILITKDSAMLTKFAVLVVVAAVAGCATEPQPTRTVGAADAHDGSLTNASEGDGIVGTPAPNSKFAKVQLGMNIGEVGRLIGGGDDQNHYPTGKGWIPFYFGSDTQRIEVLYRGEGCLTFTGGNQFGGGSNELIRMEVDSEGRCFKK
jgi:hypothetical protein